MTTDKGIFNGMNQTVMYGAFPYNPAPLTPAQEETKTNWIYNIPCEECKKKDKEISRLKKAIKELIEG